MDYEKLIRARNEAHSFRNYLGIVITGIREGEAECELEIQPELENQLHAVAGGCLYTIADTAAGSLCAGYGKKAVTAAADFHYLNAGRNCTRIYARAKQIKRGKRMSVVATEVRDQDGTLLCTGTFTFIGLDEDIDYLDSPADVRNEVDEYELSEHV